MNKKARYTEELLNVSEGAIFRFPNRDIGLVTNVKSEGFTLKSVTIRFLNILGVKEMSSIPDNVRNATETEAQAAYAHGIRIREDSILESQRRFRKEIGPFFGDDLEESEI